MTQGKDNNKPRIPDSVDMERLKKMQTVAKMKDFADQRGMGFVGGYFDPKTGEMFTDPQEVIDSRKELPCSNFRLDLVTSQ